MTDPVNCNGLPKTAEEVFNAVNALMNRQETADIGNYKLESDQSWFCGGETITVRDNSGQPFLVIERERNCWTNNHDYKASYMTCDANAIYQQSSMQRNSCYIWKNLDFSDTACAANTQQASAIEALRTILGS